jgi:hypothetical protein
MSDLVACCGLDILNFLFQNIVRIRMLIYKYLKFFCQKVLEKNNASANYSVRYEQKILFTLIVFDFLFWRFRVSLFLHLSLNAAPVRSRVSGQLLSFLQTVVRQGLGDVRV